MSAPVLGKFLHHGGYINATSTYSLSFETISGTDTGLLVSIIYPHSVDISNVTYGGVGMTYIDHNDAYLDGGNIDYIEYIYYLENPLVGTNNIQITFSGRASDYICITSCMFTNCGGIGSYYQSVDRNNPTSIVLSCSQDSLIFARGISLYPYDGKIVIDGVAYNSPPSVFVYTTKIWGKVGSNSVLAGDRTITLTPNGGGYSMGLAVEILGINKKRRIIIT